jgi:hypothetical protein
MNGSPIMIFLAQERSKPPLNPNASQSGTFGLQMQHPKGEYPGPPPGYIVHLG